jgi:hypothetical protein
MNLEDIAARKSDLRKSLKSWRSDFSTRLQNKQPERPQTSR